MPQRPRRVLRWLLRIFLAPLGFVRITGTLEGEGLPEELLPVANALSNHTGLCRAISGEREFIDESASQPGGAGDLGDLPLRALTAGSSFEATELPPELDPKVLQETATVWMELQEELVSLSSRGEHIVAEDAGHYVHLDSPQIVLEAIAEIVESARPPGDSGERRGKSEVI